MIGLLRKKVTLVSYQPNWDKLYKREEKRLLSVIGSDVEDIQHIGSTAVPGIMAKPIIDIAIGVKHFSTCKKCIKPIEKLGYKYAKGAGMVKSRYLFVKGSKKGITHHLHLVKLNERSWKNCILFRDYLRKHKIAVKEYNRLKKKLAKKYKNDRDTYTVKKSYFIKKILDS
ncbi:MAG: GrpB family protein [Patescibacteria group bacterium]